MKIHTFLWFILPLFVLFSCNQGIETAQKTDSYPDIFPDYRNIAIPVNIAPMNFGMKDGSDKMEAHFVRDGKTLLKCKGRRKIAIPLKAWRSMLHNTAGSDIQVRVYARRAGKWSVYQTFNIFVANDSIDPYIAYRLIDPGYEVWKQMGLYQRNLSNFEETPIILNRLTEESCVNCHSFHNYNPNRMLFHSRGKESAGTFLFVDGRMQRINTKTKSASTTGTYPVWHPSGNYVAFSSNTTRQTFHALSGKKIEYYDLESDLVVWDVKNAAMIRNEHFTSNDFWETLPAWSPDGKWLYFCRSVAFDEKKMPFKCKDVKYGLHRVRFDAATGRFEDTKQYLSVPKITGKSVSYPRISPDGRYLLITTSDYGTFPIWHKEADLEMIDLRDVSTIDMQAVNSAEADTYHAWSSNGRWIMFSSRRIDGLYTRLFFAYFDSSGKIHKPFLLPQKDPNHNLDLLKAYNVPEFIKGKVTISPYKISRTLKGEIIELNEIFH